MEIARIKFIGFYNSGFDTNRGCLRISVIQTAPTSASFPCRQMLNLDLKYIKCETRNLMVLENYLHEANMSRFLNIWICHSFLTQTLYSYIPKANEFKLNLFDWMLSFNTKKSSVAISDGNKVLSTLRATTFIPAVSETIYSKLIWVDFNFRHRRMQQFLVGCETEIFNYLAL